MPQTTPPSAKPQLAPSQNVTISSRDILRGQTAVTIEHDGQFYVLRVTRENKLILTK